MPRDFELAADPEPDELGLLSECVISRISSCSSLRNAMFLRNIHDQIATLVGQVAAQASNIMSAFEHFPDSRRGQP